MVHVFILLLVRQSSQWINATHVISKVPVDLPPFISMVSAISKAVFDPEVLNFLSISINEMVL